MTSTPPENNHTISDSWVDLSGQCSLSGPQTPNRVTPLPFGGEQDYLRMLREAQRESNRSSTKVSPISSAIMSLSSTTRNSPSASPKSPPNSPNPEFANFPEDFKGVYINPGPVRVHPSGRMGGSAENQPVTASELIWDWASRPNVPQKEWFKNSSTTNSDSSSNASKEEKGKKGFYFSKGIIYTFLLSNIFSLLLGAGLGMWLSRRNGENGIVEIGI